MDLGGSLRRGSVAHEAAPSTMFRSASLRDRYKRVVERLSAEPERFFQEAGMPLFSPILVLDRPASELVKCDVRVGRRTIHLYLKFFRINGGSPGDHDRVARRLRTEVEVTLTLYERLRETPSHAVPRMIASFPDELTIVTEESPGDRLLDLVVERAAGYPGRRDLDWLGSAAHSVGQWLEHFQRTTMTGNADHATPSDFLRYVDLRLARLANSAAPLTSDDRRSILAYLQRQLEAAPSAGKHVCGVHGDFGPSNILIAPDRVIVLDFAMYDLGSPYHDAAYFYERLSRFLDKPTFRSTTIAVLQDAFLSGYQRTFDRGEPLFKANRLRFMVNHLVDLASSDHLPAIKRLYQRWQYRRCLGEIRRLAQGSG